MNNITLMGRLTQAPELKTAGSGSTWMRCGIAVKRERKDRNGEYPVDFFNLTAFGATAEFIAKHFAKGSRIALIGSLQSSTFEQKDGSKSTFATIVVKQVDFVDSPEKQDSGFTEMPEDIEVPF